MSFSEKEWNFYLKKYEDKYKVYKHTDGVYQIKCCEGAEIYLQKWKPKLLAFYHPGGLSAKKKESLKRKLAEHSNLNIEVEADTEIIFVFPENLIEKFENDLRIIKKRIISEKDREKLRLRLENARLCKNAIIGKEENKIENKSI